MVEYLILDQLLHLVLCPSLKGLSSLEFMISTWTHMYKTMTTQKTQALRRPDKLTVYQTLPPPR